MLFQKNTVRVVEALFCGREIRLVLYVAGLKWQREGLQFNVREFTACAELPETGPAFFIFKNGTELCTALTETLLGIEKEYEAQEKLH